MSLEVMHGSYPWSCHMFNMLGKRHSQNVQKFESLGSSNNAGFVIATLKIYMPQNLYEHGSHIRTTIAPCEMNISVVLKKCIIVTYSYVRSCRILQ